MAGMEHARQVTSTPSHYARETILTGRKRYTATRLDGWRATALIIRISTAWKNYWHSD